MRSGLRPWRMLQLTVTCVLCQDGINIVEEERATILFSYSHGSKFVFFPPYSHCVPKTKCNFLFLQ